MEALRILSLFIGFLMIIIVLTVSIVKFIEEGEGLSLTVFIFSCFGCILISLSTDNMDYGQGQIDTLKGKYKYKMEITYEKKDSVFIPKDTTYIEIK